MRLSGQVTGDGTRILFDSPRSWVETKTKLRGKRVYISIDTEKAKRSDPQNRRFWGITVPVCREILNQELAKEGVPLQLGTEQVHRYLEERFGPHVETYVGNFNTKTCSEYTVAEFSEFIDKIEASFKTVFGAVFPDDEEMVREAGL